MKKSKKDKNSVTYKMIAEALFDNYESIYDIELDTHRYKTYFQSTAYKKLELAREGDDFFKALPEGIRRIVAPEDETYVYRMLQKEAIIRGLKNDKYYKLVYRILNGERRVYHQLRAVMQPTDSGMHILLGIKNIDYIIRREQEHYEEIKAIHKENKVELKKLENELTMSRIRNSTSQMQPHFLYNSLGSIQELIMTDPQYASDLLGDFMIHLRSCIRAMKTDELIRFSEEMKNIKAYLNIEKMRLGDKLKVMYDLETDKFDIIPLSIQPLVENAVRHGIHKKGREGGMLVIRTRDMSDHVKIKIIDTGVGFDNGKVLKEIRQNEKDSTGLVNLMFRFEKIMDAGVKIKSSIGKGTVVTVRIPKGNEGDRTDESNYC